MEAANNCDWLPTLVVGIATIIGLIGVAFITLWQTNRQIKNQNKQMHRPYLILSAYKFDECASVEHSREDVKQKENIIYTHEAFKRLKTKKIELYPCTYHITFTYNNKGVGPALNLCIYDVHSSQFIDNITDIYTWDNVKIKGLRSVYLSGDVLDENKIVSSFDYLLNVNSVVTEKSDLILFYSDLNQNIYSMLITIDTHTPIEIEKKKEKGDTSKYIICSSKVKMEITVFSEDSMKFRKRLSELGVNLNEIRKHYRSEIIN